MNGFIYICFMCSLNIYSCAKTTLVAEGTIVKRQRGPCPHSARVQVQDTLELTTEKLEMVKRPLVKLNFTLEPYNI